MKTRVVQKFGGTSIGTAERMLGVVDIIRDSQTRDDVIVAISAMSSKIKAEGTTSLLLKAAEEALRRGDYQTPLDRIRSGHYAALEGVVGAGADGEETRQFFDGQLDELGNLLHAVGIIGEISWRTHDAIVSLGERLAARLLTAALESKGVAAAFVDLSAICPAGSRVPDRNFWDETQVAIAARLEPLLAVGRVPVLTGFLGAIPEGIIEAVGRGYTDFTAALAAAACRARELQIWKEVDGVYTADPRKVASARVLPALTPREAAELTYFGSEVVHPMTMMRAIRAGIPLRIKNTFKPELEGTAITNEAPENGHPVKCVTAKRDIAVLNIESNRMHLAYGFMARVFNVFAAHGVVIDMLATSEVNLSCAVEDGGKLDDVIRDLQDLGSVTVDREMAIVSIVGQGMRRHVGLAGRMFDTLANAGINIGMISQGASEINISCAIVAADADRAIETLHQTLVG